MKGRTNPHLMLCAGGQLHVVKTQRKGADPRRLASEYIAAELARIVGLPAPEPAIIELSDFLIKSTPELSSHESPYVAGLQYGSRFLCGPGEGQIVDMLPDAYLSQVSNYRELAAVFVYDKMCANLGERRAVLHRATPRSPYRAYFVGHSECFGGATWTFADSPRHGLFMCTSVYRNVADFRSFDPFLDRLVSITPNDLSAIADRVPAEWYAARSTDLEELMESILGRRSQLRELISKCIERRPDIFPAWNPRSISYRPTLVWSRSRIVDAWPENEIT